MTPYFSKELLKAVNAWQAGAIGKKKKAAAIAKAIAANPIDSYFTSCDETCFRRAALEKKSVSELFFEFCVSEETSSWTTRVAVAADFRGGPPDPPRPGVIFAHVPLKEEVILNLERLFQHEQFKPSCEHWRADGLDLSKGIDRWGNTQAEVVLAIDKVRHHEIHAFGSNSATSALENALGLQLIGATTFDAADVAREYSKSGLGLKQWRYGPSAERIYVNWITNVTKRLKSLPTPPTAP